MTMDRRPKTTKDEIKADDVAAVLLRDIADYSKVGSDASCLSLALSFRQVHALSLMLMEGLMASLQDSTTRRRVLMCMFRFIDSQQLWSNPDRVEVCMPSQHHRSAACTGDCSLTVWSSYSF